MFRLLLLLAPISVVLLSAQEFSTTDTSELVTLPRSTNATTALLFPFVTNGIGVDTEITISNTSQDPFGSTPGSGTCILYYYGSNAPASPQTTVTIAAGQQIVFDVSSGGSGAAGAGGFQGYIVANCGFPLAAGFAKTFALVGFGTEYSQDAQLLTVPRSPASPQYLLFPFLENANNKDSQIVLTNSSQDPFGTTAAAGTCALNFYGSGAPASPFVTPSIPAGQHYVTTVSTVAPGFIGYAIAMCNFPDAAGTGFVQQTAVPHNTFPANPELLSLPRSGGASAPLVFPFVTASNSNDTHIVIANSSMDPVGTTQGSGTCTLAFPSGASVSNYITPTIASGTVLILDLATIASGYGGMVSLTCGFPQARGIAWVGSTASGVIYGSVSALAIPAASPTDLLFPAISTANGNDTFIAIGNASPASAPAGTCTFSFYGTVNGGSVPAPQTTTAVPPGSPLEIDLEQGGANVAALGGFAGYIAVSCNFQAGGFAVVMQDGPNLAITSNHTGNFIQGQQGATYTLVIGNADNAQATNGTTTVTENLPAGLTLVSMAGTGWTCPNGQNTCTRSDSLAGGAYYPTITVTVNVSPTASSPLVNSVSVSTGNEGAVTGTDSTVITGGPTITSVLNAGAYTSALCPALHANINGSNLGSSTNLPTVMVGTIQANILYNNAGQIAIEIPVLAPLGPTTVTVTVSGVASNTFPITIVQYAPGLRSSDGANGLAVCARQNGSGVTLANAPNAGESITCEGYGWGPTNPVVPDGDNGPSNPRAVTITTPVVTVGGLGATVSFSGLEPQFQDIYDVTFTVPAVAAGLQPLTLQIGGVTSNTVILPVGSVPAGTIVEFPVPNTSAALRGITSGPDGNIWYVDLAGNSIGQVSLGQTSAAGSIAQFQVPTSGASPEEIITGPDGDLWFTEYAASQIGRISTAGVFGGEFPTPTSGSKPFGMAIGPVRVWFTEYGAGKFGFVNALVAPVDAVTDFSTPTSGSNPPRIALGPDGGYWFTEQATNKIGHIAAAGGGPVVEYPIPTASSSPWGIVAGPDGNMWFTESSISVNQIGRITPSGTITEFPVGASGAGPLGITAGPDGALWFTESGANQIGRITTSGTVTNQYPIPTAASQPVDIVTGPDGALWFTEGAGHNIGRLATAFTAAPALSITVRNAGSFTQGQVGATYTLTVSNAAAAGPTSGTVTVVENLPSVMGLTTMSGTGWTCSGVTCTTSNVLAGGASYPAITVTVDVAGNASTSTTYANAATVFGGGSAIAVGADSVTVNSQATDGISEYSIPTSDAIPHGITSGPDGALWFAEEGNSGNKIGRITTNGVLSEYPVPTSGAGVEDITKGPDGALWFGELSAGKIGRITTQGSITEFPAPTPSLGPFGIVTGPDGNLWFVESAQTGTSKIGKMSTSGAAVDFAIPTSGAFATQIAVGPDGALWFTEALGNKIGRITTAGTITEFPAAANSNPWDIVAGPDGALWFSEEGTAKIGRITTGGTITEFPVPSGNAPQNLGIGPDNAIWFTETGGNQIGRVTTAGAFNEFPIPTSGSHPESIVAGPDSGMWFTEGQGNKIGRISTGLNATPVLSIQSSHTGSFTQGQVGATYTLTVSNSGGLSLGPIFVQENLPLVFPGAGEGLASMSGSGWTCNGNICSTTANVPNGGSAPPITVTVNVTGNAASPLVNVVTVYGGGSVLSFGTDSTAINAQATGTISEYVIPITSSSQLAAITAGPDGALWYTDQGANVIGRMSIAGIVTNQYTVPTANAAPNTIVSGPDGALWFSESDSYKIGRITTSGAITEFPLPNTATNPSSIAPGPDGALWFTVAPGNMIGRITTSGVITEYPVITASSQPNAIAEGSDGALWFVEFAANKIGRITLGGAVTEYAIPTSGALPYGIVTGSDGALWFAESPADQIGRITTSGSFTEYAVPTTNGGPVYGLPGPDNALWFSERQGDKIGRMTTAGVVTNEFAVPTNGAQPFGSTVAGDGGIWFVERDGIKIGRLATGFTSWPVLGISITDSGNFAPGQQGTYTITVNNAGTGPTDGTVAVQLNPPAGFTVAGASGTGWTCTAGNCTRSDALAACCSYPAITATVNIPANAVSPAVATATVYGGGSYLAGAMDSTAIGGFTIGCNSLSFDLPVGAPALSQSCTISNPNNLSLTITPSTPSGGNWLSASQSGGLLAIANPGVLAAGSYSGTVTVSGGGASATVSVNLNLTPTISISPSSTFSVSAVGGTGSFTINVTGPWAVVNTNSWITVTSPSADSSGNLCSTGSGPINFTVAQNTTPNAQTGALTLLSGCPTNGGSTLAVATLTVSQGGQTACNSTAVFAAGQQTSFTYSSLGTQGAPTVVQLNNPCSSTPEPQEGWITIASSSASSFSFNVAPYSGTAPQPGTITVDGQPITITQNPPECTYSLSTTPGFLPIFSAAGGTGSITIGTLGSTCAWTATASSSSLITNLSPSSGTGSQVVNFTVAPNTQATAQSGTITVAGIGYPITEDAPAPGTSYNCTVTADPARSLRKEGQAELVADVVLACGGVSVGGVTGDVVVTLSANTDVTNHALTTDTSHATTDALLLNVDVANPTWTLGSNAWRGMTAGPRSIRFPSVALAPQAGSFSHTFRITNIRVDASRVANASNGTSSAPTVTATVSIVPPLESAAPGAPFVLPATPVTVAGLPNNISGSTYTVLPSTSFAAGALTTGGPGGASYWPLTFTEQQAHAFLPPTATGQTPNSTVGVQYVAESGFVGTAFGNETGYSNNGRWGAANGVMGTRLMATIANLPCSVGLFAPLEPTLNDAAQLVSADSTGSFGFPLSSAATAGGSAPLALVPLTPVAGGTTCIATLTWEVTAALVNSPSALTFNVVIENPSNAGLSAVTITGGLVPQVALSATSATAPVPRFVQAPSAPAMLSFFFEPTGGSSSGNLTSLAVPAKLSGAAVARKLVPETTTGSGNSCSQTATATITNTGTTAAANAIATIQGSGPLSGCFGPTGSTAAYSGSACTVNLNNAPAAAVFQIAVTSTACTPFSYSGYATSGQGNSDPNSSDQAAPAAPIVNLYTLQTPTVFAQGDLSGDDTLTVSVINTGDDAPAGSISVVQTLPPNSGLVLTGYSTPAGDPYSQYWVCTTTATTATCTYGNNPNLTPSQEPLLNSSKLALGSTRFILSFQTATTASANVTDTFQLNTDVGGNLYGTSYTPTIAVALQITAPAPGSALPQASVGVPYTGPTFKASGGSGSYTWSATGLPSPLTMNAAGVITGTPTAATATPASVTVTVADANNASAPAAHASYTLSVGAGGGATGLAFYPVTPCRVVDTRAGQGLTGQFGPPSMAAGQTRSFTIPASSCNIPAAAQAFSLNVTVVPAATLGYLTIWPTGNTQPYVSTLNSLNGAILANAAIVPAGTGGAVSVYVTDATDLIIDINGYFAPPTGTALAFYPVTPCRVADTRNANGPFGGPSLAAGGTRSFTVPQSACGIPSTAQAYSLNMTAVPPGPLEYLTVWPAGQTQPNVSTLNALQGQIAANAAIVPAGTNGAVNVYVSNASNVILDINGYFAPPGGTGALYFYPVTPCRVADTRNANGTFGGPSLGAGGTRTFPIPASSCGLPSTAQAYSFNMTVVPPGSLLYLSTWPAGQTQPVVSTLNDLQGQVIANAAIVPAGTSGGISVYVSDSTNLVIDINGYFGQ